MITKSKLLAILQLFRPDLASAAGMCVVLGEMLALGGFPPWRLVGLGFICGFFLSGSALISNDYFDLEVDRINMPQRALPSGRITPRGALILSFVAGLIGLMAAFALSPLAFVFSVVIWILGFLYNWKLKSAGLVGNLIVCTSVAMTFVLGGIGVGQWRNGMVWTFGLIAFLFDLAEEIAGDAMDAEGDRQRDSRSLAIRRGKRTALRIAGILFGLVVVVTMVPIIWGGLGLSYLMGISVTNLIIIVNTIKLLKSKTPAEGRRAMRALYIGASAGLLAFLIGSIFV